jgi:hypothetical protein
MARLMSFKEMIAKSLEEGDAMEFQQVMKARLNEKFLGKQKVLFEDMGPENAMVTAVQNAAKSFSGYGFEYDQGVLTITVANKDAVTDLANYLDSNEDVDSYTLNAMSSSDEDDAVDLETSEEGTEFVFTVYFKTDNVTFDGVTTEEIETDEEVDEETGEPKEKVISEDEVIVNEGFQPISMKKWLLEAKRIVVFHAGLKKIKMLCPPGQKWDSKKSKCLRMSAQENRMRHTSQLIGAKKRAPKEVQMTKKRNVSLKKRVAAGY